MSRKSDITGKGALVGNNVSHANNKTKRRQFPNLQQKKVFVPELGKSISIKVTTSELRTIDKIGLVNYLKKQGLTIADVS